LNTQGRDTSGFTLIELLVVMALITLIFSTVLPVSLGMFSRYKAGLKAQEVLLYVSQLRRDAFLYSAKYRLDSRDSQLTVDDCVIPFEDMRIVVPRPIFFYGNGTSSGGWIELHVNDESYRLKVTAPLGGLSLEAEGKSV
jgi:prepilin-type N-terminal cleavage/methylation domain-containing protein